MDNSWSTLRYVGRTQVVRNFTVKKNRRYDVSILSACGRFIARVHETDDPHRFTDVSYVNLAAFMRDWRLEE